MTSRAIDFVPSPTYLQSLDELKRSGDFASVSIGGDDAIYLVEAVAFEDGTATISVSRKPLIGRSRKVFEASGPKRDAFEVYAREALVRIRADKTRDLLPWLLNNGLRTDAQLASVEMALEGIVE